MSKVNIEKVSFPEDSKLPIFEELNDIADRIRVRAFNLFANRGFNEGGDLNDWLIAEREICWPTSELVEKDDEFDVKVALAGFEAEDITVTATPNELIVKASRKNQSEKSEYKEGTKVCWSEFQGNEVYRQIQLPADVDVARIDAKFEKGMLQIEAPKTKGKRKDFVGGKKVEISGAG